MINSREEKSVKHFFSFSTPYNDWRLGVDQMKTGKYIKVSKWINDIKGFFPHIKTIRNKILRFRKHDVWNAKKIMSTLNPQNYTMVSIHVRLTDYKEHLHKLYHFKQYVPNDYFKNAMAYFTAKYQVSINTALIIKDHVSFIYLFDL